MPRLRKVLAVVALVVAACGPAPSPSVVRPAERRVASPRRPSLVDPRRERRRRRSSSPPDPTALPAGTYTKPGFRPPVPFAIEDGWFAGTVTDGFFDVQQEKGTPDVIAVQFAHVDGVASAAASPMSATTAAAAVKAIHAEPDRLSSSTRARRG